MLVSQIKLPGGNAYVVMHEAIEAFIIREADSLLALVNEAIRCGIRLTECISRHGLDELVDLVHAKVAQVLDSDQSSSMKRFRCV